ncbi:MAG: hypothetical protein ACTSQD_04575 [Promethearchaeota archaeon]|jgi:hypothetical protein
MSFKNKVKGFIDNISSKLRSRTTAIEHVIKVNNQYIDTELKLIDDSQEGITALKNYADTESIELENIISSLKLTFKGIETLKKEKIEQLRKKFIIPLQEILDDYNAFTVKLNEADKAEKSAERLRIKFDRKKTKKSHEDLEETEFLLREAQDKYETLSSEVEEMSGSLSKEKIDKLLTILRGRIDIEKFFSEKSLELINSILDRYKALENEEDLGLKIETFKE